MANAKITDETKNEAVKRPVGRPKKIRTESDIVDEMLVHYQERAERLLNSRICRYWSGVLCQNPDKDKLENFPKIKYHAVPRRPLDGRPLRSRMASGKYAAAISRSLYFWILPLAVRGKPSTTAT